MGLFGAAQGWMGGMCGQKGLPLPKNLSHIFHRNETGHKYTLPKEDPKNIWIT